MEQRLKDGLMKDLASEETPQFSPVYFYGDREEVRRVLQQTAEQYRWANPDKRVAIIRGEDFLDAVIWSMFDGTQEAYLKSLRWVDFLLFDGVDAIGGKMSTEWEFFSLFDYLLERGKRMAFGAERPPRQIDWYSERVKTQLEGCVLCGVDRADPKPSP